MFYSICSGSKALQRLAAVFFVFSLFIIACLHCGSPPQPPAIDHHADLHHDTKSPFEIQQRQRIHTSWTKENGSFDLNNHLESSTTSTQQQQMETMSAVVAVETSSASSDDKSSQKQENHNRQLSSSSRSYEDKVYKHPSDEHFLPPGDGKAAEEKYLSYLPHSGFHNQRIALVNALLLADHLNRTLLMPPVVLGEAMHWREYDALRSYHQLLSKGRISSTYCQQHPNERRCIRSMRYTSLRWDRLFDLKALKQRVNIRYRDDYSLTYLERNYNITNDDTYMIKDKLLYDYRITEEKGHVLGKYQREITMEELAKRPERHISFGSLFGTGRVLFSKRRNKHASQLRDYVNDQFVFSKKVLPSLFQATDSVVKRLGGNGSYISIHARVGDSMFARLSQQVMDKLWKDIQRYRPLIRHPPLPLETCLGLNSKKRRKKQPSSSSSSPAPLVLFIATDAPEPTVHPLFTSIYATFPCVVTLSDLFDYDKSQLATLVNPEDGINYGQFLVPFLDGMIASRANEFTGSMWSTFSSYIRFMHEKTLHKV